MPDGIEQVKSTTPGALKLNRARCHRCNDVITSTHRHDFKKCKCGRIFVDGGLTYLRRGFEEPSDFEELSEYEPYL